jgi:SAM-dependent methyltransferase
MEWINAVWQPARSFPARILVAGCGTGNEAFALADRFPASEIVALDFSPHSIALAKNAQRRHASKRKIRFAVCDLASNRLKKIAPGKFDFVSCHGVLSYVPRVDKALENISRSLAADGAFYLGVNGAGHFSTAWRQVLPGFGFDINEMRDCARLRNILALLDTVSGTEICALAKKEPAYLPGDLFGPLVRNLPLRDWIEISARAGLHFLASEAASFMFRSAINNKSFHHLIPRSRADLAQMLDVLRPTLFHRLVFAHRAAARPPWTDVNELLDWRPLLVPHLRKYRWPTRRGHWETLRDLKIKTSATNTLIELRVAEWLIEILRNSDGRRSLRQILRTAGARFKPAVLQQHLYLLHHLDVLSFKRPALTA